MNAPQPRESSAFRRGEEVKGEIPPQPDGTEPLERVWDQRLGYHVWKRPTPTHCDKGHEYRIGTPFAAVSIHWVGCSCPAAVDGGHMAYVCRTKVNGEDCKDERLLPGCKDPKLRNRVNRPL